MAAWSVIGYTFNADNYCNGICVLQAMGVPVSEDANCMTIKSVLDSVATARGINRYDEYSYDSREFPKVIFSSQVEETEHCGGCGGKIDG